MKNYLSISAINQVYYSERYHPLGATPQKLKEATEGHTTSSVTGIGLTWGPPAEAASSSPTLGFLRTSAGGRGGGLVGGCLMVPPTCIRSLGLGSMGVHCSPRMAAWDREGLCYDSSCLLSLGPPSGQGS